MAPPQDDCLLGSMSDIDSGLMSDEDLHDSEDFDMYEVFGTPSESDDDGIFAKSDDDGMLSRDLSDAIDGFSDDLPEDKVPSDIDPDSDSLAALFADLESPVCGIDEFEGGGLLASDALLNVPLASLCDVPPPAQSHATRANRNRHDRSLDWCRPLKHYSLEGR